MITVNGLHANIGEFQRNYLYKLYIDTLPASVIAQMPEAVALSQIIDIYNTKAIFPDRKTARITQKWGGEFFTIPGVDESTRDAEFDFFEDEPLRMYKLFSYLKDITGNEINQAFVYGAFSKFNIGVAKVSVDKNTITNYRRLIGVRVYSLDVGELSKEGDGLSKITVGISWDRNVNDFSMVGKLA